MTRTVGADPGHLRSSARKIAEANVERRGVSVDVSSLRSAPSVAAVERFEGYWHPARSALATSLDALEHVLRRAATAYEQRDADAAKAFQGGARAF